MEENKTNEQYDKQSMVGILAQYEEKLATSKSQRSAANELGIPRSTIRHWSDQKNKIPLSAQEIAFIESDCGFEFLHRIFIALQFVMTQVGSCGIRQVCLVMELSKLDYFIASSYESVRQRSIEMENHIGQFGDEESKNLAIEMPEKTITLAQDETFHPEICLVAMEPVSNYILLEKYAKNLSSSTWSDAMTKALDGLKVVVSQSTADQGTALIKHISESLGAHHSPDLFHVKYDISKGISGTLGKNLSHATKSVLKVENDIDNNANKNKPDVAKAKKLKKSLTAAKKKLTLSHSQSKKVKKASNSIGAALSPLWAS